MQFSVCQGGNRVQKELMPDKYWNGLKVKDRIYGIPIVELGVLEENAITDGETFPLKWQQGIGDAFLYRKA